MFQNTTVEAIANSLQICDCAIDLIDFSHPSRNPFDQWRTKPFTYSRHLLFAKHLEAIDSSSLLSLSKLDYLFRMTDSNSPHSSLVIVLGYTVEHAISASDNNPDESIRTVSFNWRTFLRSKLKSNFIQFNTDAFIGRISRAEVQMITGSVTATATTTVPAAVSLTATINANSLHKPYAHYLRTSSSRECLPWYQRPLVIDRDLIASATTTLFSTHSVACTVSLIMLLMMWRRHSYRCCADNPKNTQKVATSDTKCTTRLHMNGENSPSLEATQILVHDSAPARVITHSKRSKHSDSIESTQTNHTEFEIENSSDVTAPYLESSQSAISRQGRQTSKNRSNTRSQHDKDSFTSNDVTAHHSDNTNVTAEPHPLNRTNTNTNGAVANSGVESSGPGTLRLRSLSRTRKSTRTKSKSKSGKAKPKSL